MPENPSADGLRRAMRVRRILGAASFSPAQKLLLLGLNTLPFFHAASTIAVAACLPVPLWARLAAVVFWLLLIPPVLTRIVLARPLPRGESAVPSAGFFRWWTTWQLQMIFNRLPWIEEVLRLVPGAYSLWLRLWGARIGRLTLWSPGVRIFDRPLLVVGDDVVMGIDVRTVGHFGGLDAQGRPTLSLGAVEIGDRCTLGGASLLGPGVTLGADQATESLFLGTPFAHWQDGQQQSQPSSTQSPAS